MPRGTILGGGGGHRRDVRGRCPAGGRTSRRRLLGPVVRAVPGDHADPRAVRGGEAGHLVHGRRTSNDNPNDARADRRALHSHRDPVENGEPQEAATSAPGPPISSSPAVAGWATPVLVSFEGACPVLRSPPPRRGFLAAHRSPAAGGLAAGDGGDQIAPGDNPAAGPGAGPRGGRARGAACWNPRPPRRAMRRRVPGTRPRNRSRSRCTSSVPGPGASRTRRRGSTATNHVRRAFRRAQP